MKLKQYTVFIVIFIVVLGIFGFYFFNTSYQLSRQAKDYFENMQYEKAYKVAKMAYDEDIYNRQAFTIMTQAKTAQEWTRFIKESRSLIKWAKRLASNGLSPADILRQKAAFEVVMGNYAKLQKNSPFLASKLKEDAKALYNEVKTRYYRITS